MITVFYRNDFFCSLIIPVGTYMSHCNLHKNTIQRKLLLVPRNVSVSFVYIKVNFKKLSDNYNKQKVLFRGMLSSYHTVTSSTCNTNNKSEVKTRNRALWHEKLFELLGNNDIYVPSSF